VNHLRLGRAVQELRESFDAVFRAPLSGELSPLESFLAIRVGSGRYLLRLRELAGVHRCPPIVPLPGSFPEQLGLIGLRGSLVAAYALAAFSGETPGAGRWIGLCKPHHGVGLVFDEVEGQVSVRADSIRRRGDASETHTNELVDSADGARAVIDVPSILAAIRNRLGTAGTEK
jgi:chemotaxis signal transduction protein